MHGHARGAQAFAIDALVGQRHDNMLDLRARVGRQAEQHGLRAALPQAGDDMQDTQGGGAHRPSRTASNSSSHSVNTLASA
ncbi:hypothetical protein D3C72_2246560 [compost metagenome]